MKADMQTEKQQEEFTPAADRLVKLAEWDKQIPAFSKLTKQN